MGQLIKRVIRWAVMGGVLGLAILFMNPESVAAASETEVYADEARLRAGESVKIPVYIKNNGGVMGYLLTAEYDPGKIEINDISAGQYFANGLFEHNLSIQEKGKVDILWSYTEEVKKDGILLYFQIKAKKDIGKKKTKIRLTYSDEDTFNEKYESVNWKCAPIEIQGSDIMDSGKPTQTGPAAPHDQEGGTESPEREWETEGGGSMENEKPVENGTGEKQAEEGAEAKKDRGNRDPGNEDKSSDNQGGESPDAISGQSINIEDAIRPGMDPGEMQRKSETSYQNEYAKKLMTGVRAGLVLLVLALFVPK